MYAGNRRTHPVRFCKSGRNLLDHEWFEAFSVEIPSSFRPRTVRFSSLSGGSLGELADMDIYGMMIQTRPTTNNTIVVRRDHQDLTLRVLGMAVQ